MTQAPARNKPRIQIGVVQSNTRLCREHYRLTFEVAEAPNARPGQFVHLSPSQDRFAMNGAEGGGRSVDTYIQPMLRRAFSIAGLRRSGGAAQVDVMYRVVGKATRWMESLRPGGVLSVLGPLGNAFPIHADKPTAWLVAGGVGLPPMLWLAEALGEAGRRAVAFCGAREADLLAIHLDATNPPSRDAQRAADSCREFRERGAAVVVATDDGSIGYHGHVGEALSAFHRANPTESESVVVYTCGPERMMRFVAEWCQSLGIECHACMERAMACGTGLCQSCVVPVHDETDSDGWRYQLCCTDGPVFEASRIIWESPARRPSN